MSFLRRAGTSAATWAIAFIGWCLLWIPLGAGYWFADVLYDWHLWPFGALLRIMLALFLLTWAIAGIMLVIQFVGLVVYAVKGDSTV